VYEQFYKRESYYACNFISKKRFKVKTVNRPSLGTIPYSRVLEELCIRWGCTLAPTGEYD